MPSLVKLTEMLGWDGEEVAASIDNMDLNERKAWLLQALEEKKRTRLERERRELERKTQ